MCSYTMKHYGFWTLESQNFLLVPLDVALLLIITRHSYRDVGNGWAGWAIAHPSFGRSVNHISTRGADVPPILPLAHLAFVSFLGHWFYKKYHDFPHGGTYVGKGVLSKCLYNVLKLLWNTYIGILFLIFFYAFNKI